MSCRECAFFKNKACELTLDQKQKFTHLHGSCALNAHIYIEINNSIML